MPRLRKEFCCYAVITWKIMRHVLNLSCALLSLSLSLKISFLRCIGVCNVNVWLCCFLIAGNGSFPSVAGIWSGSRFRVPWQESRWGLPHCRSSTCWSSGLSVSVSLPLFFWSLYFFLLALIWEFRILPIKTGSTRSCWCYSGGESEKQLFVVALLSFQNS